MPLTRLVNASFLENNSDIFQTLERLATELNRTIEQAYNRTLDYVEGESCLDEIHAYLQNTLIGSGNQAPFFLGDQPKVSI